MLQGGGPRPCAILTAALSCPVPGGGTSRRRHVGAPATRTDATAVLPRSASQRFPRGAARRRGLETSVLRDDDHVEPGCAGRSEEHTSELQSRGHLVCRL